MAIAIYTIASTTLCSCMPAQESSNAEQVSDITLQEREETASFSTIAATLAQQDLTEEQIVFVDTSEEIIAFHQIGEQKQVNLENVSEENVFWCSDDIAIAMIADGKVIATGEGETVVRAFYGGKETLWQVISEPDPSKKELTIPELYYHQPLVRPPVVTEDILDYFNDVIVMGDSMSYMLFQWNNLYHGLGDTLFMVRGGVSINSLVIGSRKYFYKSKEMRPEDAIAASGRKKLYIMLGANDIPQFGIEKTMELWDSLLGNFLEKTPDLQIYIQSLTPAWTPSEYEGFTNEIIDEYNTTLESYCQEHGYNYVGIAHYFKDASNGLARVYCSDDFVHTSYKGSEVWAECLKEYALNEMN